jgi:hypothetical protein
MLDSPVTEQADVDPSTVARQADPRDELAPWTMQRIGAQRGQEAQL